MKARWISLGLVTGSALALTLGWAFGAGPSKAVGTDASPQGLWTAMEAMHDSPAMERMHAQLPEELRAQCEAMHEQMGGMMGGAGGMMAT